MKKTLFILMAAASMALYANGNQDTSGRLNGSFSTGGSTTCEPIMTAGIEAFENLEPSARITYEANGSSTGIKAVAKGTYLLAGSSRALKESEMESGLFATEIAKDGVALVVNQDVTIDNISLTDLAAIYTGKVTNWNEVGGPDLAITVINRDEASGTYDCFKSMVINKVYGKGKAHFIENAIVVSSNGDMVSKVTSTPGAIAYSGFGYLEQAANGGAKSITIDFVDPEEENVHNGSYPISRSLFIVTMGKPAKDSFAEIFINYLLSDDGQVLVQEAKYIPLM